MLGTVLRNAIGSNKLVLGGYVGELYSPGMGAIMGSTGCQFVMIDMEHSGFSFDVAKALVRQHHDAGVATMIRPPSKTYADVAKCLDIGADGIIPQMVESAEEARAIVASMKFPPMGRRGVALAIAHDGYAPGPFAAKLEGANESTFCIAMIETAAGVAAAEDIATVPGIDGLWIGHFDLTCSMGIAGQFDHPSYLAAVERVISAARSSGKWLGRMAMTVEDGVALHAQGFNMIIYSGDVWILQSGLANGLREIRERCGA